MNRLPARFVAALAATVLLLSACGRNMESDTYSSSSSVGKVVYGTVVSARSVTIKDNDKMGDNALGGIAGGAAGGVAGSAIGSGSGQDAAVVGGVIAGAVLGAVIEDQLSTSNGFEYIVKLDAAKRPNPVTRKRAEHITLESGKSVENEVMASAQMEDTTAEAISVIQQDDVQIPAGTRVMVVYRDDRARIVPAQ